MGVFSSNLEKEVRLERMRPAQIDGAIAACPAVYVPFGSIEWHGRQNPVGLDATKAHEQLVGLAARIGGIVYPPVFFGSGGGHTDYEHSYMFETEAMRSIVAQLLARFERDGLRVAILISGHYPNQKFILDPGVEIYRENGGTMEVLTLIENQPPGLEGDHAAKWETSYQSYLHPETVDMAAISGKPDDDIGGPDERINWMKDELKDHPCYGIVGIDPRGHASAEVGKECTEKLIQYLSEWVESALRNA